MLTKLRVLIKTTVITNFYAKILKTYPDVLCISIFPYLAVTKVIIGIILVVLEYQILHTEFKDHLSGSSGDEVFFSIHGHCGHLRHVTQLIYINFYFFSYEIWLRITQHCF